MIILIIVGRILFAINLKFMIMLFILLLMLIGIFKTCTDEIRKRTDTVVAFTWRVLNIVSTGKRVSQLRVLT